MKSYIARKKKNLDVTSSNKNDKQLEYQATCELGKEKINLNMSLNTKLKSDGQKENFKEELLDRISKLEQEINALTFNDVYKVIEKKHIALVTSPIKKTNLIMKNVNFQYIVKLWDYIQEHMDDEIKRDKFEHTYENDEITKKYIDETFLVSYLALKAVDNDEPNEIKEELQEKVANSMVQQMMDLNNSLTEEQLQEIISKQYSKIKLKNIVSSKDIQNKFKNSIDKYLEKIKKTKL